MSRYPGMDGIKTGYIRESGFNLTASAVRNGHRLIAVVFGGSSAVQRDNYMANLLDDGFRRIQGQPVATASLSAPQGKKPGVQTVAAAPEPPAPPAGIGELSETQAASEAVAEESGVETAAAEPAAGEMTGEGDMDFAEPVPVAKPVAASVPALPAKVQKVVFSNTPQKKSTGSVGWGVQLGTFSSKAASDAVLKKAAARLPAAIQDNIKMVELPLHTRHKTIYRAELVGLDELGARKACAVLAHCLTIKPARA